MILETLLCVLSVAIILPLVLWCLVLYRNRSLNPIPGLWAYPFFGSIFPKDPCEFYQVILDLYKTYGSKFKVYIGPDLTVVFTKPENFETILSSTTQINKSVNYNLIRSWVGDGLLTSTGNKWKNRRKLITPAFHFKILERFMKSFNIAGHELIRQLDKEVGNNYLNIYEIMNFYALDIICDTSMGVKIDVQANRNHPFARAVMHFLEIFIYRLFTVYAHFNWMFKFNPKYPGYIKSVNILQDFSTKVIEERKEIYKNNKIQSDKNDNEFGIKNRNYALLDLLLTTKNEDGKKLTDQDLRDEINIFMFAGHDTTTSALAFTLLEIARLPDIQERLYQEIVSNVGTETRDLTIKDLNACKYLDMVIKEALRKYPSVPLVQRNLCEDIWIDGIKYPKGVTVTLAIFLLHYDPELYPDPHKFDPERFATEESVKRHPYAYVPFSAGIRNCIGQKFAMYEMKSTVIKILQNYRLKPSPGYREELGFMAVLKPKNGVYISVERREPVVQITHL